MLGGVNYTLFAFKFTNQFLFIYLEQALKSKVSEQVEISEPVFIYIYIVKLCIREERAKVPFNL
jgi:hypothetical protein